MKTTVKRGWDISISANDKPERLGKISMNLSPDRSGLYLLSSINFLILHTIFNNEWKASVCSAMERTCFFSLPDY